MGPRVYDMGGWLRLQNRMVSLSPHPQGNGRDESRTTWRRRQVVEVDETYLGGRITRKGVKAAKDAKVAILRIAERSGRVHLQKIDNAKAATLKPILKKKIDAETAQVITDGHPTYVNVSRLSFPYRSMLSPSTRKNWKSSENYPLRLSKERSRYSNAA